jgi:hypothetical protein
VRPAESGWDAGEVEIAGPEAVPVG